MFKQQNSKLITSLIIESIMKELGYDNKTNLALPQEIIEDQGFEVSEMTANSLSGILSSLGIDPDTVVKQDSLAEENHPAIAASNKKTLKSKKTAGSQQEPVKSSRTKFKVDISEEAITAAAKFFEVGQKGANWYFDANQAIQKGFSSDQDRVLFAVLLAATSVQNEIYINFIEAASMFNAIKKDDKENRDLLFKFANDPTLDISDSFLLSHPEYGKLHLFRDTKTIKIANVGAKFGNIKRVLRLYTKNQLTTEVVRDIIVNSVKPSKGNITSRSPLLQKLKIANYALTLIDPTFASSKENWFNVVVDTWMFRVFFPGAGKVLVSRLFGSQVAYMNVARAISNMAEKAGVSPHVMQAALWTGIKRTWESESADVSNYVSAVERMTTEYSKFWDDMNKETRTLEQVISRLSTDVAGSIISQKRREVGTALGNRMKQRSQDKKQAVPSLKEVFAWFVDQ